MTTGPGGMPLSRDYREWGSRLSNWGRWGADDQLGTLNHLTPERRANGAALVRAGVTISLGLEFAGDGPQPAGGIRRNPVHVMTRTGVGSREGDDFTFADDFVVLYNQCSTQVDALAHVSYDGLIYNGYPFSEVTGAGAARLGIEHLRGGIQGRGVLLDLPAHFGVDRLAPEQAITAADLDACVAEKGLEVGAGDIVLVRTGWIRTLHEGDTAAYFATSPGLDLDTTAWLHDRDVAFVASDTIAVEVLRANDDGAPNPVHCVLVRDLGMPLGEIFDLEALAAHCAETGSSEFFFTCLPLPVVGAVGAPVAPIATF